MNLFRLKQHTLRHIGFFLLFAVLVPLTPPKMDTPFELKKAEAAINPEINYQGKLLDGTGAPVADGTYSIVFRLYTVPTAGSHVWTETQNVSVQSGLFSVMLGTSTSLSSVNFNQTLYLGINVEADGEMSPRKVLGAVPAAFEANNASTVGGVASTSFLRSDAADTASGLLTFTGGIISNSSSTILALTTVTATTTNLVVNGERFTDLTGTGLTRTGTTLSVDTAALDLLFASTTDFDTSAELAAILSDEAGTSGGFVRAGSPTFTGVAAFAGATFTSATTTQFAITSLTSGRVPFVTTGDRLIDSANFTFDGTNLGLGNTQGISWGGTRALYASTTRNNYLFGVEAGDSMTSGANNIALGYRALTNVNSATGNIAIGTEAGLNTNTGIDNVFIGGAFTGYSNTSGTDNIFIGYAAGGNNTTGGGNVMIGNSAGNSLVSGDDNTVYGRFTAQSLATSSRSTIVGHGAAYGAGGNYQANNLTILGREAGYNLQTGANNNILLGYNAANALTTGANNIVLGYNVDLQNNTWSNRLNIGNLIFGTGIDGEDTTLSSGNIGIGTTSPISKFTVAGDARITGSLRDSSGDAGTNGYVLLSTGSGTNWVATSSLNIGGTNPFGAAINVTELASEDFGSFTCNGTTCTVDSNALTASMIANGDHGFFSYSSNVASLDANGLTSANLTSALSDETGTNRAVFSASPAFSGTATFSALTATSSILSAYFGSTAADIADAGIVRLANAELIAWEASPAGTDVSISVNASEQLVLTGGGAIIPSANDGASLGVSGTAFADLFLAAGGVVNIGAGDTTITGGTNVMTFAGATTNGYQFQDGPLRPVANDGVALGVSGTAFSDLFLAAGAVVNFNAGDVTLTAGTDLLTLAGGALVTATTTIANATTFTANGTIALGDGGDTIAVNSSSWDVSTAGIFSGGTWQGTAIADTYVADTLTIGTGSTIADDLIVEADLFVANAATDEYCLTYESDTTNFAWQTCAAGGLASSDIDTSAELAAILTNETGSAGGGLAVFSVSPTFTGTATFAGASLTSATTTQLAISSLTSGSIPYVGTGDRLIDSANLTFDGTNLGLGSGNGIAWSGDRMLFASSTKSQYLFGWLAGSSLTTGSSNIAIGSLALMDATSSSNNIAIGSEAGRRVTSGNANVFIGPGFAGSSNTTGTQNIFIGYAAGGNSMTGDSNTFIGNQTGNGLISGGNNNYYGAFAGWSLATSSNSTILGHFAAFGAGGTYEASNLTILGREAGYNLQTGADNNILIGYNAANDLTTGANNIVIGYNVDLQTNTWSNRLNIGNLIFGTGIDGEDTTLSSGNIGIGTSTPPSKFTVAGDARITGSLRDSSGDAGTNGYVLLSTGSGTNWVATSSLGIVGGGGLTSASIDTSAELAAILTDETGTGRLVFSGSPAFSGTATFSALTASSSILSAYFGSTAADIADAGIVRLANAELIAWEASPAGTDVSLSVNSSEQLVFAGGGAIIPSANDGASLGVSGTSFSDLFLALGSVINFNSDVTLTHSADTLTMAGGTFVSPANSFTSATTSQLAISSLTSGRVPYVSTGGRLVDSSRLTYNGTEFNISNSTTDDTVLVLNATALTTDVAVSIGAPASTNLTTGRALQITTSGNAFARTMLYTDGSYGMGPGTATRDTFLSRFSTSSLLVSSDRSTGSANLLVTGNVGVGTTTPAARFAIGATGLTGSGTAGIDRYYGLNNVTNGAVRYGDKGYIKIQGTGTTTVVGSILRLEDSTGLLNTIRGLEVQAHRGTSTVGENTAISGFGRTFGVRGTTEGDAGGVFEPAGIFAQTRGTTQGNALRAYSSSITTATLVSLFHDTSAFAGTGLEMNFGNTTGSFSSTTASRFIDLQNAGTSKFIVYQSGATTIVGTTTLGAGGTSQRASLHVGFGGICVDNDGSCNAGTAGRMTSVSTATGNSDLAEMYFSSQSLKSGELVAADGFLSVRRATGASGEQVLGVVSTKPGLLLGFDDESLIAGQQGYPLALSGRVPVRLSNENGDIAVGDPLMLSSIPGVAMKATGAGKIVGYALEAFDGSRAYTAGYIDQFGDDIKPPTEDETIINTDARINDGCSFGGGGATGEVNEKCTPVYSAPLTPEETAAAAEAAYEREQRALAALRTQPAESYTVSGEPVKVGHVTMFVDSGYHQLASQSEILNELVSTSTDIVLGAEEGSGDTLWNRLKVLAQGFVDGVLTIAGLKADKVETSELCVDGVCINADDLRALLQLQSGSTNNGSSGGSNQGSDDTSSPDTNGPEPTDGDGVVSDTTTSDGTESQPEPVSETPTGEVSDEPSDTSTEAADSPEVTSSDNSQTDSQPAQTEETVVTE